MVLPKSSLSILRVLLIGEVVIILALQAGRYGVTKEMLEYLNDPGGGSSPYEIVEDDVVISETESTEVVIGFKPDVLYIWGKNVNNMLQLVYNKDFDDTKQVRSYIFGGYHGTALWNIPYTGTEVNAILSIDDNGFTIFKVQAATYTTDSKIHYIALRRREV